MTGAHSILGASSSERWMNCPGSIHLSKGMPNSESIYARQGSAAHKVAELCLENNRDAIDFLGEDIPEYDDIEVDDDMVEAVQLYLDVVRDAYDPADDNYDFAVEVKFDLNHIYPGMFGTNDAIVYDAKRKKLTVFDYKHGQGVAVDVKENSQLMYYALGALTGKHNRPIREVELVVVQPRCPHKDGPVRRWSCSPDVLLDFSADLVDAAEKTRDPSAEFKAGDWCKFCAAAGVCKTLESFAIEAARADFAECGEVVTSDPATFSSETIAQVLKNADIIENWVRSVKMLAHNQAVAGSPPPGFKLVESRPRRYWKDKDRAVEALDLYGLGDDEIYAERKLKSPNQIEGLFKKDEKKKIKQYIETLWEKKSGSVQLVPEDDDREPVKPDGAEEFS